jgi:hypothetical protein
MRSIGDRLRGALRAKQAVIGGEQLAPIEWR